jgi:uncharacterized protein YkwD
MQRCLLVAIVLFGGLLPATDAQRKLLKLTEEETSLLNLLNGERSKSDLPAFKPNLMLCEAAREHAANMAKQRKLEHKLDGKTTYDRIRATGYKYALAAENLARGDVTQAEIVQAWMKSKVHRENIKDAEFIEIGIGLASDSMGETYYTTILAAPQK